MKLKDSSLLKSQAYVNGAFVAADTGATFKVTNPATGETIAQVADLGGPETVRAIEAAHAALPAWQGLLAKERAALMRKWFDLMMANQEDLAVIMTAEQGKPLAESRGEVAYGASFIEWFAEEGKRLYGDVIPTFAHGRRVITLKQGIGVVGAVTPWNFPNAMITRKAGPALAAGCPIVLKPAQLTPLSALALAVLADRAGIPKGVFNVVTSNKSAEVGHELTGHPLVRKFTFTGSTPVGKQLIAQCATTVKKVSMELGGNAPFIIFADADLDAAVEGVIGCKYRNSGQTCISANRVLVQRGCYDEFAGRLVARSRALRLGDGGEPGIEQGPLIDTAALAKVSRLVCGAVDEGARLLTGGKVHALGGTFFEPTVLADVTPAMAITREELFGPIAPLIPFDSEDEAIALANDTPHGLAAYFYTRDLGRAVRVSERLRAGIVGVNAGLITTEVAPFGGIGQSGMGREGGRQGLDDYLTTKYLCIGI